MMTGVAARQEYGYTTEWQTLDAASRPMVKALVGGYRKDIVKPRYDSLNIDRPRSSALVDLQDPIQVHMLTETALSDGQAYEILSQEEVDDLKKQIQSLSMRVQQARSNLVIQIKYRDAAVSMAKLYTSSRSTSKRSSFLDNRLSGRDTAREAEREREMSERRCEELATELFSLEKRLIEPQRRLLEHTAGILQLTHCTSKTATTRPGHSLPATHYIPGNSDNLYTYSNPRDSSGFPLDGFPGDESMPLALKLDGQPGHSGQNSIEIPMKSPIREQTMQLRELRDEMGRLKDENTRLKEREEQLVAGIALLRSKEGDLSKVETARTRENEELSSEITRLKKREQQLMVEAEALDGRSKQRLQLLADTEGKLQKLNVELRRVIIKLNPTKYGDYAQPAATTGSSESLDSQLEFLTKAIAMIAEEQEIDQKARDSVKQADRAAAASASATSASLAQTKSELLAAQDRLQAVEGRVAFINNQVFDALRKVNPQQPATPDSELEAQLGYLQDSLGVIRQEFDKFAALSSSVSTSRQNDTQAEAVLMGLWDIIQTGLAELQQQKARRRQTLSAQGFGTDDGDDELYAEDCYDPNEVYSLQAFSTKVQWFYARATSLAEQKAVLKRQIRQQRELSGKTDNEKDMELKMRTDELTKTRTMLQSSQKENGAKLESLQSQLQQVEGVKKAAEMSALQLQTSMKEKDDELERLNGMVVELKTELTFAKAELDGAYGSRKQRAAEVAKLSNSGDTAELNGQIENLKSELASTVRELEAITRETLRAERQRLELENKMDDALSEKSRLEAEAKILRDRLENEVSRLQEQLDAERLRVPTSPKGAGSVRVGTSMLSEQFRMTMKEERKKFQEELREEQAKRRKLEEDIRMLQKSQGISRGPLSPR